MTGTLTEPGCKTKANREPIITARVASAEFGSVYVHAAFSLAGKPVWFDLSLPGKHQDKALDGLLQGIRDAVNDILHDEALTKGPFKPQREGRTDVEDQGDEAQKRLQQEIIQWGKVLALPIRKMLHADAQAEGEPNWLVGSVTVDHASTIQIGQTFHYPRRPGLPFGQTSGLMPMRCIAAAIAPDGIIEFIGVRIRTDEDIPQERVIKPHMFPPLLFEVWY